jgi:hypothetical protein
MLHVDGYSAETLEVPELRVIVRLQLGDSAFDEDH